MKPVRILIVLAAMSLSTLTLAASPKNPNVNDEVVNAITSGQLDKVKALAKKGVSIDSLSSNDQTGLMRVAEEGDKATSEQLLKLGADLNKVNSKGESALWYAVYGGHEELALSFIEKGARADQILADSKECLLHYAAKAQLAKLSMKLKAITPACLNQKNSDGQTPSDIAKGFGDKKLAAELSVRSGSGSSVGAGKKTSK